jgi:hypothetical protein
MVKNWIIILFVLLLIPIAYGIQVNSSTEIYSFEVTNCQANNSNIGCPAVDVRFSCNITPYAYIDYTLFRINGTDHTTLRSSEIFYYDWHKGITSNDIDTYIGLDRGQIHDIGGGDALFFPNASVHLVCDSCAYNITSDPCEINNTRIVHYVGDGSPNCTSYNDTESCDYCVPNWVISSNCLENNTEFRQYSDNNSCYNLTGLFSDSCDASFIDCDTWKSCSFLSGDMNCDFDVNPLINIGGNKIYWKCSITNSTGNYSCISYIKEQGAIIQTSPQQETFSSGIIARQQESREFFKAENGLVNPYFTTENLVTNKTYVFGVQCSYDGGTLTTEEYITPMYRNLEGVAYTGIWLKDNIGYILGGIILLLIIIAVAMLVVKSR